MDKVLLVNNKLFKSEFKQRKRGQITSSTFQRYRQTP